MTQTTSNKPNFTVALRVMDGKKQRTIHVGSAWSHDKGQGANLLINRPGDLVLSALRGEQVELAIFERIGETS